MTDPITSPLERPSTALDLLNALNSIKSKEFGENAFLFTMEQMMYFSSPRRNFLHYRHFVIPKRNGGVREITAPRNMLKSLQTVIARMLQDFYEPSSAVTGFVPGRSVMNNALKHVRKNYVYNADLKDFFPGIDRKRVASALRRFPFSFGREAALLLSGICCAHADLARNGNDILNEIRYYLRQDRGRKKLEDFVSMEPATLPQGAPSSPILSNIVCIRLDRRLAGLAKRYEVTYSRYADDITFSSNHNVFREGYPFLKEFRKIIADEGFTLNESKLRLQEKGQRQEVTGLVVNKKVNVCRKYVRSIGSILHIWERYGVDTAYACFLKHKLERKRPEVGDLLIRSGSTLFRPHLVETIQGQLSYIGMIRGQDDPVWQRLSSRFLKLKDDFASRGVMGTPTRYLHYWTIKRFEQLTDIKIRYGNLDADSTWKTFFMEKNGLKTEVHPSPYCRTRLTNVLNKNDKKEFERLKSEFCIGLCAPRSNWMNDSPDEDLRIVYEEWLLEWCARALVHTYSGMEVCWKIFRRPRRNIEDMPY